MNKSSRTGDGRPLSWVVEHQIQPFNELLSGRMEHILEQSLKASVSATANGRAVRVKYREGSLSRGVTPGYHDVISTLCMEGRTACVQIMADLDVSCGGDDAPWKHFPRVRLGNIPIMVGSAWLPIPQTHADDDMGGYFVVNGRDIVIPALERTAQNRVLIVQPTGSNAERCVMVYSTWAGHGRRLSSSMRLTLLRNGRIHASSEGRMQSTPVFTLLRRLGMNDMSACKRACELWGLHPSGDLLQASFDETDHENDNDNGNDNDNEHDEQHMEWLLPHVGPDLSDKAFFVCHMISVLLRAEEPDDLDRLENKAVRVAADLFGDLLASRLRHAVLTWARHTSRRKGDANIDDLDAYRLVTVGMSNALATGNWDGGMVGMTQTLSRYNPLATVADLRLVRSSMCARPGDGATRAIRPRLVGLSDAGLYDPFDSCGTQCGLTKTLAITAAVSGGSDQQLRELRDDIAGALQDLGLARPADASLSVGMVPVLVDGAPVGFVERPRLDAAFRALDGVRMRRAVLSRAVLSLEELRGELRVWTMPGRLWRPMMQPARDDDDAGLVWQVDAAEASCGLARRALEITDAAVLGPSAATVPFLTSNQGPRIAFQCKMAKQAMSGRRPAEWDRFRAGGGDAAHVLHYSQAPLVTTHVSQVLGLDGRGRAASSGINAVVAIASASGLNMEDAIVVNRQSIQRGLFVSTLIAQRLQTELPDVSAVAPGSGRGDAVTEGTVLLASERPVRAGRIECRGCTPRVASASITSSSHGMAVASRVTLATVCVPETGDKLSSRHGQKGVITVADAVDMPFTESGVVPDLIINPHGIPSRMTAGQLWEMVFGKLRAACTHREGMDTPFGDGGSIDGRAVQLRERMAELMQAAGFHPLGDEDMMDGRTGDVMQHRVFIAPTFYQRLKHLARPKLNARSTGDRDPITRQPVQGRARGGGVKTGYMELDCLNSYGACSFIHDRTFESSDAYRVHVDARTGLQVAFDVRNGTFPPGTDPVQVKVPYAMKLLIHELGAMNIVVRLNVDKRRPA